MSKSRSGNTRTRLLDAALTLFRQKGYTATRVEDLCQAVGVTKGSFFHYFASKEELTLAAIDHWNSVTGQLFEAADYQSAADPRAKLLEYVDLRSELIRGEVAEFSCLLGTLVQETFDTQPAIRGACGEGIRRHASTLVPVIEAAKRRYAANASWDAESLALYTQATIQGAFVLAKATGDRSVAIESIAHLKRYLESLFPL